MSTYLCVVAVDVEADDVDESLLEIAARAADQIRALTRGPLVVHLSEQGKVGTDRLMAALDSCLTVSLS